MVMQSHCYLNFFHASYNFCFLYLFYYLVDPL
jgi:hypothetical protein